MNRVFKLTVMLLASNLLVFVLFATVSCTQPQNQFPDGNIVELEDMGSLIDRSSTQASLRKNDIGLTIFLPKHHFNIGDEITLSVEVANNTAGDLVIRRLDTMMVFGDNPINAHGIQILITSLNTGMTLQSDGLIVSGFLEQGIPPPKAFSVIPLNSAIEYEFELYDTFGVIQPGEYSIQIIYSNYDFGALEQTETETHFIDYNAWIGVISSNIEQFQITP
jgi:hypothetical protein